MKKFFRSSLFVGLSFLSLDALAQTQIISAKIREIYTPLGFDDNDEVSITIDGFLPNNCYQLMKPQFKISQGKIEVQQPARFFPQMACLRAKVPFSSTIELGQVAQGKYEIVANENQLKRDFYVKEADNKIAPDDFIYAPVENVFLEILEGKQFLVLAGRFTNTCMSLKEEQVEVERVKNVLVVLPKMGDVGEGASCEERVTPFVVKKDVSNLLSVGGRYLIHVRSLHGRASNQVISVFNEDRP